jgi:hypothetical protein
VSEERVILESKITKTFFSLPLALPQNKLERLCVAGTVAGHLTYHPKVEGSSLGAVTAYGGKKILAS